MPITSTKGAASAQGFGWLFKAAGVAGAGLYAWGSGGNGRLGLGNTTSYSSPVQVGTLTTWDNVGAGSFHAHGIRTDGTLWSWGNNGNGQLGLNNTTSYSSPVQVGALTDWDIVNAGTDSSLALKTNGTLWAWGSNSFGKLGDGTTTNRSSPVQIGALTSWVDIGQGYANATRHAIRSGGTLWAWGFGNPAAAGQVAIPYPTVSQTNYSSPVQVSSGITWDMVASGATFAVALATDGKMYAWGENTSGQCASATNNNPQFWFLRPEYGICAGGGTTYAYFTFYSTNVTGNLAQWPNVLSSDYTTCGVGVIGDTVIDDSKSANTQKWGFSSPVQIGSLTTWAYVAAGLNCAMAIKTDGTLWGWGANGFGEIGIGTTGGRSSPVQVGALTTWATVRMAENHTMAVKTDGTLWAWGLNSTGQLGQGNTTSRSSPVQVGSATNWLDTGFDAGSGFSLGIRN